LNLPPRRATNLLVRVVFSFGFLVALACAGSACAPPPADYAKAFAAMPSCPEKADEGVTVLGAVPRPGRLPISKGRTLVEAITSSGGFTALGYRGQVAVRRCKKTAVVDVEAILDFGATDPRMADGDIVEVRERDY
jgi:hypothetical protein